MQKNELTGEPFSCGSGEEFPLVREQTRVERKHRNDMYMCDHSLGKSYLSTPAGGREGIMGGEKLAGYSRNRRKGIPSPPRWQPAGESGAKSRRSQPCAIRPLSPEARTTKGKKLTRGGSKDHNPRRHLARRSKDSLIVWVEKVDYVRDEITEESQEEVKSSPLCRSAKEWGLWADKEKNSQD